MDLLAPFRRKAVPAVGGGAYGYGGHGGPLDLYGGKRGPSPHELVRNFLGLVYACSTLNATAVAATPLRLYVRTTRRRAKSRLIERGDTRALSRKARDRLETAPATAGRVAGADDVREVIAHPSLSLLNRPTGPDENAAGMSRFSLFAVTQLYQEVVGRGYLWAPRDRAGRPTALWVLPAHLVTELPDLSGERVLAGYQYTSGLNGNTDAIDPAEMVAFRMPDLHTGGYLGGWGPARAAYEQIRILRQHDAHVSAVLDNSGFPGAVFTPKGDSEGGTIGSSEARRLTAAFRQAFAAARRGGVFVSESPGTLTPLAWRPAEVLTPEQYQQARATIAAVFGVPLTKIDRNIANRASAESGDFAHAVDAVVPRCRCNEEALNASLLPAYEPDVDPEDRQLFFAYDEPAAMHNDEAQTDKAKAYITALTVNEKRAELGYGELPGGDVREVPTTMALVDPVTGRAIPGAMPTPARPGGDGPPPAAKRVRTPEY